MRSLLKNYKCEWENALNTDLINKTSDDDLVDYIKDVWRSLEVLEPLKIVGFEYSEKESDIDINDYVFRREKRKKKKDKFDLKYAQDDRVGLLTIKMMITLNETDPSTGALKQIRHPVKKRMLIPLMDEDGYYHIKGHPYYMIYQLLEKSTYVTGNNITLKSLMPVAIHRDSVEIEDTLCDKYKLPYYMVYLFKKPIIALLFYLAKGGMDYMISFTGMNGVISFLEKVDPDIDDPDNLYFILNSKLVLKVAKDIFNKHIFVQSVVAGIYKVVTNRISLDNMNDTDIWTKKIANPPNLEKGASILASFNRLEDETTKKILKLPDYYKSDSYSMVLWLMQHFNELRLKDNHDLKNKRIRCNEYIAALLTKEFSNRLNRILQMGKNVTVDNILDMFKFPGDILLTKLHLSGVLRFDDNINDMTIWSKLRYTTKGPNSLGGINSNNISSRYRDVYPSHLGEIDVLVCSNSEPGTHGVFSPFANIDGLYFDDSDEESGFMYELSKDLKEKYKDSNITYITLNFDNPKDYYNSLSHIKKSIKDGFKVMASSKETSYDIIIEKEADIDDKNSPQTYGLRKKVVDPQMIIKKDGTVVETSCDNNDK